MSSENPHSSPIARTHDCMDILSCYLNNMSLDSCDVFLQPKGLSVEPYILNLLNYPSIPQLLSIRKVHTTGV
jgi:hypothetical protein